MKKSYLIYVIVAMVVSTTSCMQNTSQQDSESEIELTP